MLRSLAVAALLVLVLPASVVGASPREAEAFALQADALLAPATSLGGDPSTLADPSVWIPLVQEHGRATAGYLLSHGLVDRQSGARRVQQEPSQPPADGSDPGQGADPRVHHEFAPLGDANGNGRDDVLLFTEKVAQPGESFADEGYQVPSITIQALDGGRDDKVLWTYTTQEGEYAYIGGDLDDDGVLDLESYVDGPNFNHDEAEQTSDIRFLSGRDLAVLATVKVTSGSSSTTTEPSNGLPVGNYAYRDTYRYEYVHDVEGVPGIGRLSAGYEFVDESDRIGPITTRGSWSFVQSSNPSLLRVDGSVAWAFEEPNWSLEDQLYATNDEVYDYLLATGQSFHYEYQSFPPTVEPPVSLPVPIPNPLAPPVPAEPIFELRMLDGADGRTLWQSTFENVTFTSTRGLGNLFGDGEVIRLTLYDIDDETGEESIRTVLMNAVTGAILREEDQFVSYYQLGDADRDGDDDLLQLLPADGEQMTVRAINGQLETLWSFEMPEDDYGGITDVTGDRVLDVLVRHGDHNVTVRSGTDGTEQWSRRDDDLVSLGIAPGIARLDDRELVMVLSPAGDDENVPDFPIDMLVLRGTDGAPLWRKPLYDPKDYLHVASDHPYVFTSPAGDLNGDGANDFIVDMVQFNSFVVTICDDDGCRAEQDEELDGQPLRISLLVDGADGSTITRFDDMLLAPKVKEVQEEEAVVKPAAKNLGNNDTPGLALWAALAAVGVALALRRRKA